MLAAILDAVFVAVQLAVGVAGLLILTGGMIVVWAIDPDD